MGDTAPTVQQFLGDSGVCPEIPHAGRAWKIGHPTQRAKACLEELVAAQALAEVKALAGVLGPEDYAAELADVRSAIRAKQHRTWGALWTAAVNGPEGPTLFLLSLLRERHPEATADEAADLAAGCPDEVAAALDRVVPPFFGLLVAAKRELPPAERERLTAELVARFRARRTPTS